MRNKPLLKILAAIFLATIAALCSGSTATIFGIAYVRVYALIGELFLNALTLVVVPLVASSIVLGTARMGREHSFGKLGVKTFGAYIGTTMVAIFIGLFFSLLISPGTLSEQHATMISAQEKVPISDVTEIAKSQGDTFQKLSQILLKIVPANILAAASEGQMLGVIFFCLLFGIFISQIEEGPASIVIGFWNGIFQVMMKITHMMMKALPIGVFGLVAKVVATTGLDSFISATYFFITVIMGLATYVFIFLPLLLKIVGGVSPIRHFRAMAPALFTVFSTSSSAATLPVTMECVELRAGVSNSICSFIVPLGTSLNLSGTALYQCIAVIFIAQIYGVALTIPTLFIIVLMTLLTSIGMAGIPSASLIAIMMILETIGLPTEGVGYILAVERILDMFRSTANVFGNSCCAVLVARSEGEINVLAEEKLITP